MKIYVMKLYILKYIINIYNGIYLFFPTWSIEKQNARFGIEHQYIYLSLSHML